MPNSPAPGLGHSGDPPCVEKADRRGWLEHLWHRHDSASRCSTHRRTCRCAANGGDAWFGWPSDDKLEQLRTEWLGTSDSEVRQEIAVKIQQRAFETVPYVPTGQWSPVTAYRNNVKGIIIAPALFMWNVEKT